MELLRIQIHPNSKNYTGKRIRQRNYIIIVLISIGVINIFLEFLFRRTFSENIADSLIEMAHIFIYFILPLLVNLKKIYFIDYVLFFLFFIVSAILYASINYGLLDPYANLIFLPILFLLILYSRERHMDKKLLIFFNPIGKILLYTILSAILIGGHLFFVISLSQHYSFQTIQLVTDLPKLFYMVFGVFGMEIFFRGFIFNKLNRDLKIPFWISASLTTLLFIGPFLANPFFTNNPRTLTGILFYLLLMGFVFCALAKKTRSIIPSYLLNLLMAILRYAIILGTL